MNKRKFVQARRPEWENFRKLLDRVETRPIRKLPAADLDDFSRLLREVSNDLAVIRSREWGRELEDFLNHLVTRGYNQFYSAPPGRFREFLAFATVGFPRELRRHWKYFALGWALFFLPLLISWAVVQMDPSRASAVLPSEQLEAIDEMYGSKLYDPDEDGVVQGFGDQRAIMAGFYIRNNVGIALICFAIGILFGIGTIYLLLFNGVVLGALSGYVVAQSPQHADNFLSFVVTHGSFELTAIAIAGAAGLMLGDSFLHRGNRTVKDAFRVQGLDSVKVAFGAALMLVVAAGIEAFWSPSPIPSTIKYIVGLASWVFVYAWLALAGRGK